MQMIDYAQPHPYIRLPIKGGTYVDKNNHYRR